MLAKIDESPAKEEVAGGRPYDEADAEDERKTQTVRPVRPHLFPPNLCTYEGALGCNPEHRDNMIDMNTWLDSHWEEQEIVVWEELWMLREHYFDFQVVGNLFYEYWEGACPYASDKVKEGGREFC